MSESPYLQSLREKLAACQGKSEYRDRAKAIQAEIDRVTRKPEQDK